MGRSHGTTRAAGARGPRLVQCSWEQSAWRLADSERQPGLVELEFASECLVAVAHHLARLLVHEEPPRLAVGLDIGGELLALTLVSTTARRSASGPPNPRWPSATSRRGPHSNAFSASSASGRASTKLLSRSGSLAT